MFGICLEHVWNFEHAWNIYEIFRNVSGIFVFVEILLTYLWNRFGTCLGPRRNNIENRVAETHFSHMWAQAGKLLKIELPGVILSTFLEPLANPGTTPWDTHCQKERILRHI